MAGCVEVEAISIRGTCVCPTCGSQSTVTHGWYNRHPQELPSVGQMMRLCLQVRRFCCINSQCSRRTFAEQFPNWLPAYARRTDNLTSLMYRVGLQVSAEVGHQILSYLQVKVSGDTLLRILRKKPLETQASPVIIGVDDWAFKKGRNYGTIVVNLETHRVYDLLPDRTAETLAQWLQVHPSIKVVTRDRSTEYASGIRQGAPQAMQVADRWHLLLNMRQMLTRYITLIYAQLQDLPVMADYQKLMNQKRPTFIRSPSDYVASNARRDKKLVLYHTIQSMRQTGWNIAQLASELGHHRDTIRKYYYASTFPERKPRRSTSSILDPYLPYLKRRLEEGCENALQLWREIQNDGYPGSKRQVIKWMQMNRTTISPSTPYAYRSLAPSSVKLMGLPSSTQLAWLLVRDPMSISDDDQILLRQVQQHAQLNAVYAFAQRFVKMVKERLATKLDSWIADSKSIDVIQIQNFAWGLQQDHDAVYAALATEWSNGQTEGQVNRLKFIKRQMYGRAKFDLLRLRVLAPP